MTQTQPQLNPTKPAEAEISEPKIPVVVNIKPSLATAAGVKAILPEELYEASISKVIQNVLGSENSRKYELVAGRVKNEMKSDYGLTVNSEVAGGNERVADYLAGIAEKETPGGMKYKEVEIIIAAKQEGGLETILE